MPERNHPTIPEIVQALVTLNDRHQANVKKIRADHVEQVRRLHRRLQESAKTDPMPPMDHKWDRYDIEYAEFVTDEDGDGFFINKYRKAPSRDVALSIARELLANNNVAGIHLLFQKHGSTAQWEREGHAQTDMVAKLQSEVFKARKESRFINKLHGEAVQAKERAVADWERDVESLNIRLEARDAVIERLLDKIRAAYGQCRRDNNNCTYSEPLVLMNLLAGVGQEPDEQWYQRLLNRETNDAKAASKRRKDIELAKRTGVWPLAPLVGASDRRRCACERTWHMDEVPENHNGLECQPERPKDVHGEASVCVVKDCGHDEERHTSQLPEEGGKPYCIECDGAGEFHAFQTENQSAS